MTVDKPKRVSAKFRSRARILLVIATATALGATALFLIVTLRFRDPTLAPALLEGALFSGLGAAAAGIVLGVVIMRHWVRWFLLLLLPLLLAPLAIGAFMLPVVADVAEERLPDGRTVHLAIAPVLTDRVYDLWLSSGLIWRRVDTDLNYSEDGRFIHDEKLALSRDGRRLLVGRGGIWTDCLAIAAGFAPCDLGLTRTFSFEPDFETKMRSNSEQMAKLL